MRDEIQLVKLRASTNEQKYKGIDKQMETEISRKYGRELLNDIYKQWEHECEKEELISLWIWE